VLPPFRVRMLPAARPSPVQVALVTPTGRAFAAERSPLSCLGSGRTAAQAARRARAELVERLSGFYRGHEPRVRASWQDIAPRGIHPHDVLLYSRRQYRRGEAQALDARARLDWSPLWSITAAEWRYVPTQLLYYRYPMRRAHSFGRADSNGVAAGRTFAAAAARGLLELIERDSVALWWYNRAPRPRVDLAAAADSWVRRLSGWHDMIGRECWALDLTSDLGVPVVAAVSRRRDRDGPEEIVLGFGAHLDRGRALSRALLEMSQMLAVAEATRRGELAAPHAARRWWRDATVRTEPHLVPNVDRPRAVGRTGRAVAAATVVRRCAARLAERGLEVLVMDQTRSGYGLQVARVVVPGLRPWHPRFATGRLYDAPVAAGWRGTPLRESQMSRQAIFF